jgi:WD40 repeat protein
MLTESSEFQHDLFISYSTDPDYIVSQKIEGFLERFHKLKVPEGITLKQLRVCRDGSDFSIRKLREQTPDEGNVKNTIAYYLHQSRYLLVLCSRNAALSEYVSFEVNWFIKNRGADSILLAITEGDNPTESKLFSEKIIQHGLHTDVFFDLRGFKKNAKNWRKVRDQEEELTNIAAFLNGETSGRILPVWQRSERKKLQRQRYAGLFLALVFLGLAITAFIQRRTAIAQKVIVQNQLARYYWNESRRVTAEGNEVSALHFAAEAVNTSADELLTKSILIDIKSSLPQLSLWHQFPGDNIIFRPTFSADGRWALVMFDSALHIWDTENEKQIACAIKQDDLIVSAKISPDGKWVLVTTPELTRLWSIENCAALTLVIRHERSTKMITCFSQNGKWILTANNRHATLWDSKTLERLREIEFGSIICDAVFNNDNSRIMIAGIDGIARQWEIQSGTWSTTPPIAFGKRKTTYPVSLGFFENHLLIAQDNVITVWDVITGETIYYKKFAANIYSIDFDSKGKWFRTEEDQNLTSWEFATGNQIGESIELAKLVVSAACSPDGDWVITSSFTSDSQLWKLQNTTGTSTDIRLPNVIDEAFFSADGERILARTQDTVRIFNARTGQPEITIPGINQYLTPQFIDYSNLVVAIHADDTARVWNIETGNLAGMFMKVERDFTFRLGPASRFILTNGTKNKIGSWKLEHGKGITRSTLLEIEGEHAEFSPDGERLLTIADNKVIRIWDTESGVQIGNDIKEANGFYEALFSPDGEMVLTRGGILGGLSSLRVWRSDGKFMWGISDSRYFTLATFSPDGQKILAVSMESDGRNLIHSNHMARLYDTQTGIQTGSPMLHRAMVSNVKFTADGNLLFTTDQHGAYLWESITGLQIENFADGGGELPATISKDGHRILIVGGSTATILNVGIDLDLPKDVFKLQAQVSTGYALDETTNEVIPIPVDKWNKLKEEYDKKARDHFQNCRFPQHNFWSKF